MSIFAESKKNPHASVCLTCQRFLKHKRMKLVTIPIGEDEYQRWQCLECLVHREENDALRALAQELEQEEMIRTAPTDKNQDVHFREKST